MLNGRKLDGLRVGFGGDLSHGRTVRSLSLALSHFSNVTVRWAAEDFLGLPADLSQLVEARGVEVVRESSVRDVMAGVDFYYMTRPQLERMEGVTPRQIMQMIGRYKIDMEKVGGFDVKLMHPLPVNSELAEIDYHVYFSPVQAFYAQAEFGIFLRKAVMYEMLRGAGYVPYSGRVPAELERGNNRLPRAIKDHPRKGMFIDAIRHGTVIDHLGEGTIRAVDEALALEPRGYSCIAAVIEQKRNPFLKTDLPELHERDLKAIALLSPQPTINYIRDGKVVDKFVYLLCRNENCIVRVINEDVPPRFYNDGGTIRCRYCRRSLPITSRKVTDEEQDAYLRSLPRTIEPVRCS
jgi:aspartate carbamoyltransferase regulatory subunit